MYPEEITKPMKLELTSNGFKELSNDDDVTRAMAHLWELWVLCFWWSSWTLADQYLIQFHPWSELAVLGGCMLTLCVVRVRSRMSACKQRLVNGLAGVTQTETAGPYAVQTDAV